LPAKTPKRYEEFLAPLGISQYRIAKDISVPARRINEIVHGQRSITADTALRFGRYFNMSPQFWLNLQAHYDLDEAEEKNGRCVHPEEAGVVLNKRGMWRQHGMPFFSGGVRVEGKEL